MVNHQAHAQELDRHFTEFGIPYRNLWYMLLYAWKEPPDLVSPMICDVEDAPSLDALLCQILIKLVQQRFRIGLGRDYLMESKAIRGIRGKINFSESLKQNLFDKGQSYCQYYEYHMNVPKNQIIRTTMMKMIRLGNFGLDEALGKKIRQNLRMIVRAMDGIDFVELTRDLIERQQLGRNDRDYRIMLSICRLLLQKQIPTDTAGQTNIRDIDRDSIVFHDLFEKFVANFYKYHLLNWEVHPQKHISWHEINSNEFLPIMKADILFKEKQSGRVIFLDTKFTSQTKRNQWGDFKYDSGHLYQIYSYVKSQENFLTFHPDISGVLLYPAKRRNEHSEVIKLPNHRIKVVSIDLTKDWKDIENQLLSIVYTFA